MPRVTIKRCLWVALGLALVNLLVVSMAPGNKHRDDNNRGPRNLHSKLFNISRPEPDGSETQTFNDLSEAQKFMESHDLRDVSKIVINYPNVTRGLPNFVTDSDREIFLKSERNRGNLQPTERELLHGEIHVIRNGTFQMFHDCGYKSNASYFEKKRFVTPGRSYYILVPLVIPMGYLFQHFYDGTLPKIAQAYGFLQQPNVTILLEKPYHPSIYAMLEALHIPRNRIAWHKRSDSTTVYHAQYMVTTCVAPPLHPLLWKAGRRRLGVPDAIQIPYKEGLVMFLTRAGATNAGRRALNSGDIESYLKARYGDRLLIFKGGYTLDEAKHIFSRVKIIIGTHGGAFYNMNFAPLNTTVIEFVPTLENGADIPALPHAIFWAMAELMGQPYWRVPCKSMNLAHDMLIDLNKLNAILDKVDPWDA